MQFRLVRYVTVTSLAFFLLAALAMVYFYRQVALTNMLHLQEAANVNVTRVFANTLWTARFVPFLAESDGLSSPELKNNSQIQEIHRTVLDLMRGGTTYKVKVYDRRGRTVYSSELAQIGEDKSGNSGFQGAMAGQTRTELVHKEKFSAFEQVVENRDLIQSYIPQYNGRDIAGVFEVYSDVTPFLGEIAATEKKLVAGAAVAFGALYLALFLIVRRAEGIIVGQNRERDQAQQQLAQSEKMASLGQLVAGVAHQLNTPIAFSLSNVALAIASLNRMALPLRVAAHLAENVRRHPGVDSVRLNLNRSRGLITAVDCDDAEAALAARMLGDVQNGLEQMRELVENLRDFTRLDRAKVVGTDLNRALRTVIYIAKSAIPGRIQMVEDFTELPLLECNPSQLNQVFLNLINNAAQAIPYEGHIRVRSRVEGREIRVDVIDSGGGIPQDVMPHIFDTYFTTKAAGVGTGLGLPIARDIVRNHGGELRVTATSSLGTTFTVTLPLTSGGEPPPASRP